MSYTNKKSVKVSKGILYTFFIIYLIVVGLFLEDFIIYLQRVNPGQLPVVITYIPFVCYLGSIFSFIGLIIFIRNVRTQKSRELKSRGKSQGSLYKNALFIIIFGFSFVPLLGPVIDKGINDHNFSIYNNRWNGCSEFRELLEDGEPGYNDYEYDVMSIQTSLSATERLNKSILLILMGPNSFYNPIFEIPYFVEFLQGRNSILICHDHGSTSELLWQIFIASALSLLHEGADPVDLVPVTLFPRGYLRDNESYDTTPEFPKITQLYNYQGLTDNVNQVILSKASAAVGDPLISAFGWKLVGEASGKYSFVDKNGDKKYDFNDDFIDLSFMSSFLGDVDPDLLKIPLGYPITPAVFLAKETTKSRIFVSSDASLWNNELIDRGGYDNKQLAMNVIEWLTYNEGPDDWVIAFDEAHIRPEQSRDLSSAGIYGIVLQYVIHLSTNPITAWIYPLLAIYSLRRYLPKKGKKAEKKKIEKEEKKEEKMRFRTSSFFAKKIEWYHEKRQFNKALTLLNRRLDRKLHAQLGDMKITTKNVIDLVQRKDPNITRNKVKRISRFIDNMLNLKVGKLKIKNEIEFEDLFFEMEWVVNNM